MTRTQNAPPDPRRDFRGGSWIDTDPAWLRPSDSGTAAPSFRYDTLGFRVSLPGRKPR